MIRAAGVVGAVFEPEALFGFAHDCRRQTAQPCDVVAEEYRGASPLPYSRGLARPWRMAPACLCGAVARGAEPPGTDRPETTPRSGSAASALSADYFGAMSAIFGYSARLRMGFVRSSLRIPTKSPTQHCQWGYHRWIKMTDWEGPHDSGTEYQADA
jgi:hypothetical protein